MLLVAFLLLVPVSLGQMARGYDQLLGEDSGIAYGCIPRCDERAGMVGKDTEPKKNKSIRINRELAARGGIGSLGVGFHSGIAQGGSKGLHPKRTPFLSRQSPVLALTDQTDNYLVCEKRFRNLMKCLHLDLLDTHAARAAHQTDSVLKSQSDILVQTLGSFGIEGSVTDVHPGPVITMYEFAPGSRH